MDKEDVDRATLQGYFVEEIIRKCNKKQCFIKRKAEVKNSKV